MGSTATITKSQKLPHISPECIGLTPRKSCWAEQSVDPSPSKPEITPQGAHHQGSESVGFCWNSWSEPLA